MLSADTPKYWFRAKRYGWGWGLPSEWQGWVVLLGCFGLVFGGIPFIQIPRGDLAYIAYASVLTVGLIAVCWLNAAPARTPRFLTHE